MNYNNFNHTIKINFIHNIIIRTYKYDIIIHTRTRRHEIQNDKKKKKHVVNKPQVQCSQVYHRKWLLFSLPRFLPYTFQNLLA